MPSVATSRPSTLPETTTDAAVTDPLKLAVVPNRAPVIVSPDMETDSVSASVLRSFSSAAVIRNSHLSAAEKALADEPSCARTTVSVLPLLAVSLTISRFASTSSSVIYV